MSISSWVGSVWSLRGAEGAVIGQVRAVVGESLFLTIGGLDRKVLDGVEILSSEGRSCSARVSVASLLAHWDRMTGNLARLLAVPHHEAA